LDHGPADCLINLTIKEILQRDAHSEELKHIEECWGSITVLENVDSHTEASIICVDQKYCEQHSGNSPRESELSLTQNMKEKAYKSCIKSSGTGTRHLIEILIKEP